MRHTPHSYVNLKGEKMGTWGTGIYSNDIAEDVRDACKDIFALYDVAEEFAKHSKREFIISYI